MTGSSSTALRIAVTWVPGERDVSLHWPTPAQMAAGAGPDVCVSWFLAGLSAQGVAQGITNSAEWLWLAAMSTRAGASAAFVPSPPSSQRALVRVCQPPPDDCETAASSIGVLHLEKRLVRGHFASAPGAGFRRKSIALTGRACRASEGFDLTVRRHRKRFPAPWRRRESSRRDSCDICHR